MEVDPAAAALVRELRQNARWINNVDSLQMRVNEQIRKYRRWAAPINSGAKHYRTGIRPAADVRACRFPARSGGIQAGLGWQACI